MKFTRLQLAIVLAGAAGFCVCWSVVAQEGRPLWTPPPVLPADEMPRPTVVKSGMKPPLRQAQPAKKDKSDPTLIIPPEVYELPRPVERPRSGMVTLEEVVQTGGVVEPPTLKKDDGVPPPLPAPPQLEEKKPVLAPPPAPLPPPLPAIEPKAITPPPLPEPAKVLIAEPLSKGVPKLEPSKTGVTDPIDVPPALEPKQMPSVVKPDVNFPPPTLEPRKEPTIIAPAVVMPEPKQIVTPTTEPRKEKTAVVEPQIKSFVPVRSGPPAGPLMVQPPPNVYESSQPTFNPAPAPISKGMVPPTIPGISIAETRDGRIITPTIAVEKRGPNQLQAGESQTYQIIVRNVGNVPAKQVRIEDEIAPEVRAIAAEPLPQVQGSKAIWTLPVLAPGAEQTLRISLQANSAVQLTPGTNVHVTASNAGAETTLVMRPRNPVDTIAVQLNAPGNLSVGKPAVFDVRVTNLGLQPFTGLTLRGFLGDGFTTPEGNEIVGKIDVTLKPGEVRTLKMPATAVKPGRHSVSVKVAPGAGLEVAASVSTDVIGGETAVVQTAPVTKLLIGRDGEVRIDIVNQSSLPMRNVDIASRLPEGLEFVGASERGLYQANSRTVFWHVENLPAAKSLTLQLRLHGLKAGQFTHSIFLRADGTGEIKGSGIVSVEGVADLTLRVIERDNPLELGKDTAYEIQVVNPGTSPARDVQIRVEFPPGMQPRPAQGNMKYSIEGQTVIFEPIPSLPSKEQSVYRVSATARSAGDQRVRFAVVSDQVRTPVQREISTLVYRD